jgi:hypothetical protein
MSWIRCADDLPALNMPVWGMRQLDNGTLSIGIYGRVDVGYVERDHSEWVWAVAYRIPDHWDGKWNAYELEHDDDYHIIAWQALPEPMPAPTPGART